MYTWVVGEEVICTNESAYLCSVDAWMPKLATSTLFIHCVDSLGMLSSCHMTRQTSSVELSHTSDKKIFFLPWTGGTQPIACTEVRWVNQDSIGGSNSNIINAKYGTSPSSFPFHFSLQRISWWVQYFHKCTQKYLARFQFHTQTLTN